MSRISLLLIVVLVLLFVVATLVAVLWRSGRTMLNPNLEPCPDCGRQVSLQAATCPHCGCPLEIVE